jgi:hypothetical protein
MIFQFNYRLSIFIINCLKNKYFINLYFSHHYLILRNLFNFIIFNSLLKEFPLNLHIFIFIKFVNNFIYQYNKINLIYIKNPTT